MPTVNIYFQDQELISKLQGIIPKLKGYIAEKLTCGDIKLTPKEISIRFIKVDGGEMIGAVEVEVTANAFKQRVEKQDEICRDIMNFIQEETSLNGVRVWLSLSELGHSWEKPKS